MKEIFVISNDKFFLYKNRYYNSNKNTFTILNSIKKFNNIFLISRKVNVKQKFSEKIHNISFLNIKNLFDYKDKIKFSKVFIISLTPFNFFVCLLILIFGAKKKNTYLFLRSDGFQEYKIKFGVFGYFFYGIMLNIIKGRLNILSCSQSIKGNFKSKLLFPSEINNKWLDKRKFSFKSKKNLSDPKLLYVGRFRIEKGYLSLIELFKKLKIKSKLEMIGNDQKYFKKTISLKRYNIKIRQQISNEDKLIKFYDNCDILVLPSFVEAYPQVILESLARLKPIIIFDEIKYLKKTFKFGLYSCKRNEKSFEKTIESIMKNYKKIQKKIYHEKIFTKKKFFKDVQKILRYQGE